MGCLKEVGSEISMIEISKLNEGLSVFGYKDLVMPKSRKNFDFNTLDFKSIRIMNRLSQFVLKYLEDPLRQLRNS